MNKKSWIALIVILTILVGIGCYFYFNHNNNNQESTYESERTSTSTQTGENRTDETKEANHNNQNDEETAKSQEEQKNAELQKQPQYKEEQIATFSTKIYSKDSARQNNIKITCNTLNGTTVQNGSTFSFCNTVGQATTAKGYQKADIYDNNGKKKKGLGGGNCQISSTLYNAVLSVSSLDVTERHAHSNNVPYVKKGKDAAVAYGSYDFKFRNNTGNTIKINCSTDGNTITTTLVSLKQV